MREEAEGRVGALVLEGIAVLVSVTAEEEGEVWRVWGRGEATERLKEVEVLKGFDGEGTGKRVGQARVVRVGVRGRLGAVEFELCGASKEVEGVSRLEEGGVIGGIVEIGVLKELLRISRRAFGRELLCGRELKAAL